MGLILEIVFAGAFIGMGWYLWQSVKYDFIKNKYWNLYLLTKIEEELKERNWSFQKLEDFGKQFESKLEFFKENKKSTVQSIDDAFNESKKASKKEAK